MLSSESNAVGTFCLKRGECNVLNSTAGNVASANPSINSIRISK